MEEIGVTKYTSKSLDLCTENLPIKLLSFLSMTLINLASVRLPSLTLSSFTRILSPVKAGTFLLRRIASLSIPSMATNIAPVAVMSNMPSTSSLSGLAGVFFVIVSLISFSLIGLANVLGFAGRLSSHCLSIKTSISISTNFFCRFNTIKA